MIILNDIILSQVSRFLSNKIKYRLAALIPFDIYSIDGNDKITNQLLTHKKFNNIEKLHLNWYITVIPTHFYNLKILNLKINSSVHGFCRRTGKWAIRGRLDYSGIINCVNLEELYYPNNEIMLLLNNFKKLKILHIENDANIEYIDSENLEELSFFNCPKITNLHNLCKLKKLIIHNNFNIDNSSLCPLLEELSFSNCPKITNINHLGQLKTLKISSTGSIVFDSCRNLTNLDISAYDKSTATRHEPCKGTSLNHLVNLKKLVVCGGVINENDFKDCTELEVLIIKMGTKISNCNLFTKLKKLHIGGGCIDNNGISECINLEELVLFHNNRITLEFSFEEGWGKNLKMLDAGFSSVSNIGLKNCPFLETLYADNNPNITDCNHLSELKFLNGSKKCGITDAGVIMCKNLITICSRDNSKLTSRQLKGISVNPRPTDTRLEQLPFGRIFNWEF